MELFNEPFYESTLFFIMEEEPFFKIELVLDCLLRLVSPYLSCLSENLTLFELVQLETSIDRFIIGVLLSFGLMRLLSFGLTRL